MANRLTDLQQRFIDVLFDEDVAGDYKKAKEKAGYSDSTSWQEIVKNLEEEIATEVKKYVYSGASSAAFAVVDLVKNPMQAGANQRLKAATDILDRAGLKATDKVEVKTDNPVFILPAKKSNDAEEETL